MSKEMKEERVYKVTLSTKKSVFLREPKIKHNELAIRAVGNRAGDNKYLFSSMVQKELLKILIHSVDGKKVTGAQIEDMDALFNMKEYGQVLTIVSELTGMGGEDEGKPQVEFGAIE